MMAIVLNPTSGPTRRPRLREEIEELFRESGLDARIRELTHPCDISAVVRHTLDEHPDAVVAGGGDGTISAVASVLAGTPMPMGVLPLGTLNHFARDAGIPFDLQKAVETARRAHTSVSTSGASTIAFSSTIRRSASIRASSSLASGFARKGVQKGLARMATADVLRREGEVKIRLEDDRTRVVARTPFVFVGNNEYCVEGFKLGVRTRLDEGRLHAYFAPPARTRDLPALFAHSLFGFAHGGKRLETMSGPELWVDTPLTRTINVACDGEVLTLTTPLHYQSWPGALTLIAPAS